MAVAARSEAASVEVAWRAQEGPQTAMIACPVFEVFFGGARGGGKTDGMLGDWIAHAGAYGENAIGLMVRRERTQLIETMERSKAIYARLGAKFHEQEKMWRFPNGARLRFAYLERDADADAYQGHSYTRIYVEELGTFASPAPVMKLMATLRSGAGVPCGFRATGNPGGPGHQWVKARYINPAPLGWKVIAEPFKNPWSGAIVNRERVYIPSRLTDNQYLGDDYVASLQMSGSTQLVRAWLEGDWDVIEGAFFDCWDRDKHVIAPFVLPPDWLRFRSIDWGSAKPFSVGWWAVVGDDPPQLSANADHRHPHSSGSLLVPERDGRQLGLFPRGALIRYKEWYGCKPGQPDVGLKLTAEEVAQGILARSTGESYAYTVADPSMWRQDGGPSHAERMLIAGLGGMRPGDNTRVAQRGAMGGWDMLRNRMKGLDGKPMIYWFSTCTDSIRTIPALQHDPDRPEDLDTNGEDHPADETRYAAMSRPWVPKIAEPPRPTEPTFEIKDGRLVSDMSVYEIVQAKMRKRAQA